MGFPPERKYQAEGGPTLRDCFSLLREWSSTPVLDVPSFVNGLIFNVLIGNADAHGKNYSLVYTGGERRLSPFYDLVSTLACPELSTHLAMSVGDCTSVNVFTLGEWEKMARATGLGWPLIRERMAETCYIVLGALETVQSQTEAHDRGMVHRLHETTGQRANRMIKALGGRSRLDTSPSTDGARFIIRFDARAAS